MTAVAARGRQRRALGSRLRGAPAAMWLCAAVATLNAMAWAIATPSFQVVDEPVHVGYVQYVAETGSIPRPYNTAPGAFDLSEEEGAAMAGVPFSHQGTPTWDRGQSEQAQRDLRQRLDREHEPGAGAAAPYPPLYYLLGVIPYKVASGASFYDRLLAMRLFSALFAGATAAFCFLFVRELLPGTPWSWTCGGLAVALHPVVANVSGGVNPDSLLWAASAALLWATAMAFQRGLTPALGAGMGAALAVALLTKGAAFSLVGAAAVALALLLWRARAVDLRPAAVGAALATVVAAVPFGTWLLLNTSSFERPGGTTTSGFATPRGTLTGHLEHLWQTFLPPLPGMAEAFPTFPKYPIWDAYFQGFVGRFGFSQYGFSYLVNQRALVAAALLAALVAVALVRSREAIRRRFPETLAYLAFIAAVFLLVGIAGYRFRILTGLNFEQTRYLFPLLGFYAAAIGLAARAVGPRFGPAVGAAIVGVAAAHDLFAVLVTLMRYYS